MGSNKREYDCAATSYISSLKVLEKQRELYKLRNDAQRYLQLGEQNMFERVAPIIQKPVTEKLDEVKEVLGRKPPLVPKEPVPQPKITAFNPLEVFEKIIQRIDLFPKTRKPSKCIRVMKSDDGYVIGSNPIEVIFHDQGRDIKINDYQMPFSEDLEKILQMPKVKENGEELKTFKSQTLQDYVNLLTSSNTKDYKRDGNYLQAVRLLKDNPPSYRIKPGSGIDATRVLTLLAAKAEGHNNVDKELAELTK